MTAQHGQQHLPWQACCQAALREASGQCRMRGCLVEKSCRPGFRNWDPHRRAVQPGPATLGVPNPGPPPVRPPEFELADLGGPGVGDPRRGQSRLECPRLGSLTLGPPSSALQQGVHCMQCSRLLARGCAASARTGARSSRAPLQSCAAAVPRHARATLSQHGFRVSEMTEVCVTFPAPKGDCRPSRS